MKILWSLMKEKQLKTNIKIKQELKDKVIEIKVEIKGLLKNCVFYHTEKTKRS